MKTKRKKRIPIDELLTDLLLYGRCAYKEYKNGKIVRVDPLTGIDEFMKEYKDEIDN